MQQMAFGWPSRGYLEEQVRQAASGSVLVAIDTRLLSERPFESEDVERALAYQVGDWMNLLPEYLRTIEYSGPRKPDSNLSSRRTKRGISEPALPVVYSGETV